ncbi:MAG TPA: HIT family protein [Actinomycetaceae bacterium]|nr:HIT family protein [Actinomycetaceae bacterium]
MSSVFTKIINGEIPGRFVWADDVCVVFATIAPITPGHMLVVPRAEVDHFTDADDDLLSHLMVVTKTIGAAQRVAWQAPRAAVLVAGFEVPHLHIHVLPAWNQEALSFSHARSDVPAEELDSAAERVRVALRAAGHDAHVPTALTSPDLA